MIFARQTEALIDEALRELDRLTRLELERVGQSFLRWLDGLLPRMPCDTWRDEFNRFVANLARDQLFIDEESRLALIAWLNNANEAAKRDPQRNGTATRRQPTSDQDLRPVDERHFPDDLPSPFDPAYPQLRRAGDSIMRQHPPAEWLARAIAILATYHVPEQIRAAFLKWLADKQRRLVQAEIIALAESNEAANSSRDSDPGSGGVGDNSDDLHWIRFERYVENEGILVYKTIDGTGAHWWRVPVKKIMYRGREVYDLRGAVEFEPTFVQGMLLERDGILDDAGWRIIVQHYLDRNGDEADQQLQKDLATGGAVQALRKYARAQLVSVMLGLAAGKAVKWLKEVANPKVRKALDKVRKRLERAVKDKDRKKVKQELEKAAEELRDIAKESSDAETKKTANEIADQIDAEVEKTTKEAENVGGKAGTEPVAEKSAPKRERNRDKVPERRPVEESRRKHGSAEHDATAFNRTRTWEGDPATVEGSARFNQELVDANGKVHPEFKPDAQRIRRTADGRFVVDVYEVRSDGQSDTFMDEKIARYKKTLGGQAGDIKWDPPIENEKRK